LHKNIDVWDDDEAMKCKTTLRFGVCIIMQCGLNFAARQLSKRKKMISYLDSVISHVGVNKKKCKWDTFLNKEQISGLVNKTLAIKIYHHKIKIERERVTNAT
jgi:hypothetical protein